MKRGILVALLIFLASTALLGQSQQGYPPKALTFTFGHGMNMAAAPFLGNDLTRINWSENMFIHQPGSRTSRWGIRMETEHCPSDSSMTGSALFIPQNDSAAVIYTAGGKWWLQKIGVLDKVRRGYSFGDDDFDEEEEAHIEISSSGRGSFVFGYVQAEISGEVILLDGKEAFLFHYEGADHGGGDEEMGCGVLHVSGNQMEGRLISTISDL